MNDTTDAAASGSAPVFRLIYRSQSRIAPDQRATELGALFTTARRNNKRLGITGALMTLGDSFVQALEGDEAVVRDLYATISKDPRHDSIDVIEEQTVDGRTFGRWAMAKVSADGGPDLRLLSNAKKQVIVETPGKDLVTPEQQALLATMRATLTLDALET